MSLGEFWRWSDYFGEEPPLTERLELLGGIIASTIANVNRGKTSRKFTPQDFMPITAARDKRLSDELDDSQFAALQMMKFRAVVGGKGRM